MKLVREHINEKFTEKSDPIRDMGIGVIPFKEVKKLTKQLENKFNEIFNAKNVKVTLQPVSYSEDEYEVFINFKNTGWKFWFHFLASRKAAEKYFSGHTPAIKALSNKFKKDPGWYIQNRNIDKMVYVEPTDFDEVIKQMLKINISSYWNAENLVKKNEAEIQKLNKKIELLKSNIDTSKTIEKILHS